MRRMLALAGVVALAFVPLPAGARDDKDLGALIADFNQLLLKEDYREAAKVLLLAQERFPGESKVLNGMRRYERILQLSRQLDSPIRFRYTKEYKERLKKGDQWRRLLAPTDTEVAASFLATATLFLGAAYVSGWVDSQEQRSWQASSAETGTLMIEVTTGEILRNTVKRFTITLRGDRSTGYVDREDSSGNSFFQSGYAIFSVLPIGKYEISMSGYNHIREKIFAMNSSYYFAGGTVVCEANLSTKLLRCR